MKAKHLLFTLLVLQAGMSHTQLFGQDVLLECNTEVYLTENKQYTNQYGYLIDVRIVIDGTAECYELEYGKKGFQHGQGALITPIWGNIVEVSIGNENLQSNTEYDYYVRAKCGDMHGDWSEKRTFTTTEVFHYSGTEVFEVYFDDVTNKSVEINWIKLVGDRKIGGIIEYGPKGFERGKGRIIYSPIPPFTLEELEADTEYALFIRSHNTSESDPVWTVEHTFKTLPCDTEISNIETTPLIPTGSPSLSWKFNWDETADAYELEYGERGFEIGMGERIYTEKSEFIFFTTGLKPNTEYDYYVRGKCEDAYGAWSAVSHFYTGGGVVGLANDRWPILNVYPNPTDGLISIDLDPKYNPTDIALTVYSMEGIVLTAFNYQQEYDLSFLKQGMYLLHISDKNNSSTILLQKK